MNIDLIETISRSLSNADIVNLAVSNPELHIFLKDTLEKRRLNELSSKLEDVLRFANNARIFANKEIANWMFMCEDDWMHKDVMEDILEKMASYLEPMFETVDLSYDDFEPNMTSRIKIDDFVIDLNIDAGIMCASQRPVYDWCGVSFKRIDIYHKRGVFLMSWTKKYEKRVDTITYGFGDFVTKKLNHHVRDTFVRFDTFRMTPQLRPVSRRDFYEDSDDSDDDSSTGGYDSEELDICCPCVLHDKLITTHMISHAIGVDETYHKYATEMKRVVDSIFTKRRNIIEDILYKTDEVTSKFLLRYQTWSTCKHEGYVHAREYPEWFDKDFDAFVDALKSHSQKLFDDWVCDMDYINDGYEQLWTFTRKIQDATFVLTMCLIEGGFSWNLQIGKYEMWINPLAREYSFYVDENEDPDCPNNSIAQDDDGKQFEEKKLHVLFEEIGLKKTSWKTHTKIEHFTKEELDNILH